MRSITLKLLMSATVTACSVITPHQPLLPSRLAKFNLQYDVIMDTSHASLIPAPPSKAQLAQMEAVGKQAGDFMGELGCFTENFNFGCASLLAKSLVLELKVLSTKFHFFMLEMEEEVAKAKVEKEEASAKAKAEKELKAAEKAAGLGSVEL